MKNKPSGEAMRKDAEIWRSAFVRFRLAGYVHGGQDVGAHSLPGEGWVKCELSLLSDAVSWLLLGHLKLSHRRPFPSTCAAPSHVPSSVERAPPG